MIRTEKDLRDYLNVTDDEIDSLLEKKIYYTKVTTRKNGKPRVCHNPPPAIKKLQRTLVRLLATFPTHSAAMGSVKGNDRYTAARLHRFDYWFIECDIKDCFPSVPKQSIVKLLKELGFSHKYAVLIGELVTYKGYLQQGPPTSPILFNLLFRRADQSISDILSVAQNYSRYVDNITISAPKATSLATLQRIAADLEQLLCSSGYILKGSGVTIRNRMQVAYLLGLSITTKITMPKSWYSELRILLHKIRVGEIPPNERLRTSIRGKLTSLEQAVSYQSYKGRYYKLRAEYNSIWPRHKIIS